MSVGRLCPRTFFKIFWTFLDKHDMSIKEILISKKQLINIQNQKHVNKNRNIELIKDRIHYTYYCRLPKTTHTLCPKNSHCPSPRNLALIIIPKHPIDRCPRTSHSSLAPNLPLPIIWAKPKNNWNGWKNVHGQESPPTFFHIIFLLTWNSISNTIIRNIFSNNTSSTNNNIISNINTR